MYLKHPSQIHTLCHKIVRNIESIESDQQIIRFHYESTNALISMEYFQLKLQLSYN
jgi:hypothetical protein